MSLHMSNEVEKLKKMLLSLCSQVEKQLWLAVKSIKDRHIGVAREVIDRDHEIDQNEVDIEEECLKILALYQPVAIDLRFIVTAMKINSDLERIGDLAVNIAERSEFLSRHDPVTVPFDFDLMAAKSQTMLRKSIEALVNIDSDLAGKVCIMDDEVDAINKEMYDLVKQSILARPEDIECLIHLLSVSRHLERIGDHATNIAEDVIYMAEGKIIRHKAENYD
ncbi:MAG: phosphate transport system regulatory protein PhoU [Planctomycetota bacterium]|nr:MAG: phosphate transport system regulatory protein PhoU [Planctomycetota bacterium]